MPADAVVDRLAGLPLFASVPRADLEWLAAQGEVRTAAAGTVMSDVGTAVDEMFILLAGRTGLYAGRGTESRKLLDAATGAVLGILPYSRFRRAPGSVVIEEDVTALVLHERHFPELVSEHHELTTVLVHHMLDRAREYRTLQLNDDRLQSLSRLASGFAHELNNPASAAARTAQSLEGLLEQEERAARELAGARLGDDELAALDQVRRESRCAPPERTALETADREDDIADWLARHGIDLVATEALAASDVTMTSLDRLAQALPPDALTVAARWIASRCAARMAAQQIAVATGRIHDLVGAVKAFTFMDRHGVPEPVDVARGLTDTLAMLDSKARAKSVTVRLETAPDLPRVHGFGSEINQVWQKLVDNALDAVGDRGRVTITASTRGDSVLVRFADDGAGIPEDIQTRVFDPFFTTKPLGQGTGLGLDIARRLVKLHEGDIDFTSQPGRTVFRVRLPIAGPKTMGAS